MASNVVMLICRGKNGLSHDIDVCRPFEKSCMDLFVQLHLQPSMFTCLVGSSVADLDSKGVKFHIIKMYGRVEPWLYTFLTFVIGSIRGQFIALTTVFQGKSPQ
jgi:hypothetical protein